MDASKAQKLVQTKTNKRVIHRFEALEKDVKQTTSNDKLVMEFDQARIGKRVFQLEDASLSINGQQIVKNLDWIIQSQARVGIAGGEWCWKIYFPKRHCWTDSI